MIYGDGVVDSYGFSDDIKVENGMQLAVAIGSNGSLLSIFFHCFKLIFSVSISSDEATIVINISIVTIIIVTISLFQSTVVINYY